APQGAICGVSVFCSMVRYAGDRVVGAVLPFGTANDFSFIGQGFSDPSGLRDPLGLRSLLDLSGPRGLRFLVSRFGVPFSAGAMTHMVVRFTVYLGTAGLCLAVRGPMIKEAGTVVTGSIATCLVAAGSVAGSVAAGLGDVVLFTVGLSKRVLCEASVGVVGLLPIYTALRNHYDEGCKWQQEWSPLLVGIANKDGVLLAVANADSDVCADAEVLIKCAVQQQLEVLVSAPVQKHTSSPAGVVSD
ncbi:hypothetical protein GGI19_004925, partial [Coemansia pectinata]